MFFIKPNKLPSHFFIIKEKIRKLNDISAKAKISISALALNYCLLNQHIDKIIIGADNVNNLVDSINSIKDLKTVFNINKELDTFIEDNEEVSID